MSDAVKYLLLATVLAVFNLGVILDLIVMIARDKKKQKKASKAD